MKISFKWVNNKLFCLYHYIIIIIDDDDFDFSLLFFESEKIQWWLFKYKEHNEWKEVKKNHKWLFLLWFAWTQHFCFKAVKIDESRSIDWTRKFFNKMKTFRSLCHIRMFAHTSFVHWKDLTFKIWPLFFIWHREKEWNNHLFVCLKPFQI